VVIRSHRFWFDREEEQASADRQTASLAALAFLLLLVVLGLFLVRTLTASCAVEDCLLAGRRNCDAVAAAHPAPVPW